MSITADGRPSGDDGEPDQNPMLGYRESLVRDWPGPARPDDADADFPDGWRRTAVAAIEAGAVQTVLVDALERRRSRGVRARHRRPAPARRAPARARGGRGRPERGAHAPGGRRERSHHVRAVPEALLLVACAPAAAIQRTGGAHRHRDPRLDRAPRPRPGTAARARGSGRPHRRRARRRPRPRRAPA